MSFGHCLNTVKCYSLNNEYLLAVTKKAARDSGLFCF
jgi:hypothetical protein